MDNTELNSFDAIEGFAILGRTKNSYMFDDYGEEEWLNCIYFLLQTGHDADDVAKIVGSKHMRWSSDARDIQTGEEFQRYYHEYKSNINRMLAEEW